jgi:hypothetical protein
MTDQSGVPGPTCGEGGCIGVQLAQGGKCLAHASDEQRNETLTQFGETGEIDARGVPITAALLEQILAAAPRNGDDRPTFTATRFDQATFRGGAGFNGATFQGTAGFGVAIFQGFAEFNGVTFRGGAGFNGATFQGTAGFDPVTFRGDAGFIGATVRRHARFHDTRFEQARQLGPLLVYGVLFLDAAHFAQLIRIEASSRGLSCQRARFLAGVQFRLRGAQIVLDDAELPGPSLLTGVTTLSDAPLADRERRLVQAVRRLAPQAAAELSARPRLLSVQGANVAGLVLAHVDLAECRFAGAYNLHKLRMEADVSFAVAPVRLGSGPRQGRESSCLFRARAASADAARPRWSRQVG